MELRESKEILKKVQDYISMLETILEINIKLGGADEHDDRFWLLRELEYFILKKNL